MIDTTNTEKTILASLMISEDTRLKYLDMIKSEYFYYEKHCSIFKAMCILDSEGHEVDIVSVDNKLKNRALDYLLDLTEKVATTKKLDGHIETIKNAYIRRSLIKLHNTALNQLSDSDDQADAIINTVDFETVKLMSDKKIRPARTLHELLPVAYDEMDKRKKGNSFSGIVTPLKSLNDIITGFNNGELWVIAGLPSMGKTTLAVQIAVEAMLLGKRVVFYSFEMSDIQLVYRILAYFSGVSGERIAKYRLSDKELKKIGDATNNFFEVSHLLTIDNNNYNIIEMARDIRKKSKTGRIDLVVSDYLTKQKTITHKGGRNDLEIGQITSGKKDLCLEYDFPWVELAQFSRKGNRDGQEPRMSDLFGSSQIEADIDGFIKIHNPTRSIHRHDEDGDTYLIVDKNRNGSCGKCQVYPDLAHYRFYDVDEKHDDTMDYTQEW